MVQWHYHHKTPLCYVAVWAEITCARWKLECFLNTDLCGDGMEGNRLETIIKRETLRNSYELHTLAVAFVSSTTGAVWALWNVPSRVFGCSFSLLGAGPCYGYRLNPLLYWLPVWFLSHPYPDLGQLQSRRRRRRIIHGGRSGSDEE